MNIGKKLLHLRRSQGLTQQEVADRLGVTRQSYSYYESEERNFNVQTFIKLSEILHFSMDNFFGKDEDYFKDRPYVQLLIRQGAQVNFLEENDMYVIEVSVYRFDMKEARKYYSDIDNEEDLEEALRQEALEEGRFVDEEYYTPSSSCASFFRLEETKRFNVPSSEFLHLENSYYSDILKNSLSEFEYFQD